jgi:hypothetical protein
MILQGMWVLPLVRDEVVWIHETLNHFFRDLSRKNKEEKSAAKKVLYFLNLNLNKYISAMRLHSIYYCFKIYIKTVYNLKDLQN